MGRGRICSRIRNEEKKNDPDRPEVVQQVHLSDGLFRGRAESEGQYDRIESHSPETGHDDPEGETNQVA